VTALCFKGKREEARRKKQEGRRKREEVRGKKQEGRGNNFPSSHLKLKIQN
jgi:hypothetical protein